MGNSWPEIRQIFVSTMVSLGGIIKVPNFEYQIPNESSKKFGIWNLVLGINTLLFDNNSHSTLF